MGWPSFLVIGAYKSGTTALHHALRAHPEVFVPERREPSYFAFADAPDPTNPAYERSVRDEASYLRLFDSVDRATARGEVSPEYLLNAAAADSIARRVPGVTLLAVLRNPVDRAFSDWAMYVRDGAERADFATAIALQDTRRGEGQRTGYYLAAGAYADQLERYVHLFAPEQIHVWLYDDLAADEPKTLREVFAAVGVDPDASVPLGEQHNVGHVPTSGRDRLLLSVRTKARPLLGRLPLPGVRSRISRSLESRLVQPTLDPAMRVQLTEHFRPDIERLQELIDRDLSVWLTPSAG